MQLRFTSSLKTQLDALLDAELIWLDQAQKLVMTEIQGTIRDVLQIVFPLYQDGPAQEEDVALMILATQFVETE